ncbi:MAG TPA: hypothetical protein VM032_11295 [Vicinamibacterales bacterium]|nr:hypothetical protein [Vicinamibacterales bacterium]
MDRTAVSVIVTTHGASPELARCLAAICRPTPPDELFVADGADVDTTFDIQRWCPSAVVLHRPGQTVPELRWSAVRVARGEVIVATESRMEPGAGWWQQLADAHRRWPRARTIGGTVECAAGASAMDRGLYLSEYAAFAPGSTAGEVDAVSSGNLSYKRAALEESRDLLDRGVWDTVLLERWRGAAGAIRLEPIAIAFLNGMSVWQASAMRVDYGRAYAAERVRRDKPWRRAAFAAGAVGLPLLLTVRALASAARTRSSALTPGGAVWLLVFNTLWAAGEFAGYLAGDARRKARPRP